MGEMQKRHRIAAARDGNRKGKRRVPCGPRRLNRLAKRGQKRRVIAHGIAHWQAIPAKDDCASVAAADPGNRTPTSCRVTQASGA